MYNYPHFFNILIIFNYEKELHVRFLNYDMNYISRNMDMGRRQKIKGLFRS